MVAAFGRFSSIFIFLEGVQASFNPLFCVSGAVAHKSRLTRCAGARGGEFSHYKGHEEHEEARRVRG